VLATLDPAQLAGSNLAIDAAYLYFVTPSGAMRVPIAGGTPATVGAGMRGPIVLDANNVYGFDPTGIVSAPKSGGALTSVSKGSHLGSSLAVDATTLYFHSYYGVMTNGDNYHQSIYALTLATGTVLNIATTQFVTGPFASDADTLYWFSDNQLNGEIRLMSLLKTGGTATALMHSPKGSPDGPAFDGTNLYWTTNGAWSTPIPPPTVVMLPATGGTPSLVASPDNPGDLAVDATAIYFTDGDAIEKVPKTGGTPTLLSAPLNRPHSLVLDDASVYWIDAGDGKIEKTAK
jgi:hypothetical protein